MSLALELIGFGLWTTVMKRRVCFQQKVLEKEEKKFSEWMAVGSCHGGYLFIWNQRTEELKELNSPQEYL